MAALDDSLILNAMPDVVHFRSDLFSRLDQGAPFHKLLRGLA